MFKCQNMSLCVTVIHFLSQIIKWSLNHFLGMGAIFILLLLMACDKHLCFSKKMCNCLTYTSRKSSVACVTRLVAHVTQEEKDLGQEWMISTFSGLELELREIPALLVRLNQHGNDTFQAGLDPVSGVGLSTAQLL